MVAKKRVIIINRIGLILINLNRKDVIGRSQEDIAWKAKTCEKFALKPFRSRSENGSRIAGRSS